MHDSFGGTLRPQGRGVLSPREAEAQDPHRPIRHGWSERRHGRQWVVVTAVALLLTGCAGSSSAPPPRAAFAGLVGIGGGRTMYLECRGAGAPTVVFVSGLQDRADTWSTASDPAKPTVLPEVATFTRVCVYDRPGTVQGGGQGFQVSRSAPVPQPTTPQDAVADLHALLSTVGEPAPYVLVGHSAGGLITKLYTSAYPEDVSGLVLVDALSYDLRNGLTPEQWELWKRLNRPTEEDLALYEDLERLDHERSLTQERAAAPLLPLPLTVLSGDRPFDLASFVADGRLPPEMEAAFGDALWRAVLAAQEHLARLVPNAKHIAHTNSGHYIHHEQPQLVIDAIRDVVGTVAAGNTHVLSARGSVAHFGHGLNAGQLGVGPVP